MVPRTSRPWWMHGTAAPGTPQSPTRALRILLGKWPRTALRMQSIQAMAVATMMAPTGASPWRGWCGPGPPCHRLATGCQWRRQRTGRESSPEAPIISTSRRTLVRPGRSRWARRLTVLASSADGTKLVAGVYEDYIYTSKDSGATWTQTGTQQTWQAVASSADGKNLVAAAYEGYMYTSKDSGATWTQAGTQQSWQAWRRQRMARTSSPRSGPATCTRRRIRVRPGRRRNLADMAGSGVVSDGTKLVAVAHGDTIYTSEDSGRIGHRPAPRWARRTGCQWRRQRTGRSLSPWSTTVLSTRRRIRVRPGRRTVRRAGQEAGRPWRLQRMARTSSLWSVVATSTRRKIPARPGRRGQLTVVAGGGVFSRWQESGRCGQ